MEKAVPTGSKTTQSLERSMPARPAETSTPAAGSLAQLAAMVNRSPRVQTQLKLSEELRTSGQVAGQQTLASEINAASSAAQFKPAQTKGKLDEKLKQPKFADTAQTKKKEELRQHKMDGGAAQLEAAPAPNKTGLPDNLKAGVESLSGVSLNNVKVHYNSPRPAQLNALAYAQGTDIHVAAGQQKHLPHEAWHIAQQSQGRVKPTTQTKGVAINDDSHLEREADVMGAKAASIPVQRQVNRVAQLGKSKGFTKKRKNERRIRAQKDRPDNPAWIPSGEVGVGDPPEGFATWLDWVKVKEEGKKMK
jgi:hypothetical protein